MNSIRKYTDLENDYFEYNAWKPDNAFSIQSLNKSSLDLIREFEIEETIFEGVHSQREESIYNEKLNKFKTGLKKDINESTRKNTYLFVIEHKPDFPNRLRTYKGIIDQKKVNQNDFIQIEIELGSEFTIIACIARFNAENIDYLISFFFDDATSFIIKSDNEYLDENTIDRVIQIIDIQGNTQIDYAKLLTIPKFKNDIICRIGGNSGEDYWSIQKFVRK